MNISLRSAFEKVRDFFVGVTPPNAFTALEFAKITEMMKERGCDLEITHRAGWRLGFMEDIGIVADEKTNIYKILHAEGHLEDVFEIVTGRPLDRKDIKRYDTAHMPTTYDIPFMF